MRVSEVLETCLYARDLEAALAFYRDVLGLEPFARSEGRHVFFRLGRSVLLVFNPDVTGEAGSSVPPHGAEGPGHVAFAVPDESLPAWRRHLEEAGVEVEAEMTWTRGGRSLYVRDPEGNSVELAEPRIWGFAAEEVLEDDERR